MPDFKVINMNSNIDDCCYMLADTISDSGAGPRVGDSVVMRAVPEVDWAGCPGPRLSYSAGERHAVQEVRGAFFATTAWASLLAPFTAIVGYAAGGGAAPAGSGSAEERNKREEAKLAPRAGAASGATEMLPECAARRPAPLPGGSFGRGVFSCTSCKGSFHVTDPARNHNARDFFSICWST